MLGAGASKSYTQSPSGVRMPISNDFFQTFFRLPIAENPWVLYGKICEFLISQKGIDDPYQYLSSGVDIEVLHSEVSAVLEKVTAEGTDFDRVIFSAIYHELIYLFVATLNYISNGPVSAPHKAIAEYLNEGDVLMTFNWDTLMDKALRETRDWNPETGYGFKPLSVFRNGWQDTGDVAVSDAPSILKLHGSANWLTGAPLYQQGELVLGHGLTNDSVFVYESTIDPYDTFRGRFMEGYEDYAFGYYPPNLTNVPGLEAPEGYVFATVAASLPEMPEGGAGEAGVPSLPLIIPPVKNKTYEFYGELFTSLWDQAKTALIDCEELIIVGYSFPPTDARSLELFRTAFMARTSIPKVTLIDPSPERASHTLKLELGISEKNLEILAEPFKGQETINKIQ
jgi:hypothetical protein